MLIKLPEFGCVPLFSLYIFALGPPSSIKSCKACVDDKKGKHREYVGLLNNPFVCEIAARGLFKGD